MVNENVAMTLDEAVDDVLGQLTGLDLTYDANYDRYRVVARQLNRALRAHALEAEWSYYSSVEDIGPVTPGQKEYSMRSTLRPRIITDDAVRLVDRNGTPRVWAYYLPRDSLHKYPDRSGLWVSYTRSTVQFSRALGSGFAGYSIQVPVMREPVMFDLPKPRVDEDDAIPEITQATREQLIDYDYPDVIVQRAAFYVAQSDPVMQPRAQMLEAQYKDLMYQLIERDQKHSDSPFLNEFTVPISSSLSGPDWMSHGHPHSDERR